MPTLVQFQKQANEIVVKKPFGEISAYVKLYKAEEENAFVVVAKSKMKHENAQTFMRGVRSLSENGNVCYFQAPSLGLEANEFFKMQNGAILKDENAESNAKFTIEETQLIAAPVVRVSLPKTGEQLHHERHQAEVQQRIAQLPTVTNPHGFYHHTVMANPKVLKRGEEAGYDAEGNAYGVSVDRLGNPTFRRL